MIRHELAWTAPQPFWTGTARASSPADALGEPQILRFATDDFMAELLARLERDPASLAECVAYRETWRGPVGAQAADPALWLQAKPRKLLDLERLVRRKAGPAAPATPATTTAPVLKLYQPAHQRHYLVGGALVCRTPGLPDRQVDPARQKVVFVLRRLFPVDMQRHGHRLPEPVNLAEWEEHAFEPQGKGGTWRSLGRADREDALRTVQPREERLPMFPSHFVQDDGLSRRLFVGNVPVGRREAYQAATRVGEQGASGAAAPAGMDPRVALFHTQVLGPWKALAGRAMRVTLESSYANARPDFLFEANDENEIGSRNGPLDAKGVKALRQARSTLQTGSWYLLLDLRDFLVEHLGAGFLAGTGLSPEASALRNALDGCTMPLATGLGVKDPGDVASLVSPKTAYAAAKVHTSLLAALGAIGAFRERLESATRAYDMPASGDVPADWPDFLFLFSDPWFGPLQPVAPGAPLNAGDYLVEKVQARIDTLANLLAAALPEADPSVPVAEAPLATMTPTDMRDGWYLIRLVYECPGCAPFQAPVVSAATRLFQMAGFFDPDAPARPIRIGLPVDISPAGLRKFDKNTAFMLSDMLCGQVDRMKGITLADLVLSVLPWPFHKDLSMPEKGDCTAGGQPLGVMCSLSIPIVTLCALLLLMIIVSILDYFFRWMPYFIMCFPLPGFKGRK
ncbi:hypothetical protein H8N03_10790 [Ramlibacter sp. USB13]|uniref:Uncharacterized protein n=1 Tax=Ramlibacter cellulosilyticus TaxID=2764187 RepID=A0A923SEZ0_9BURK|nr:hypothetical protein [Ramlibacter cellulosilyticus]MBC5783432.1 hypothetical protein [Ramlibacter cellulosilyticus]